MKRKILPIPILGCLLCAFVVMAQDSFYAYYRDGSIEKFSTNNVDSISLVRPHGTVTDVCGNTYNFLLIGDLLWFTENLRCDKRNDGTEYSGSCYSSSGTNTSSHFCYAFGQNGYTNPNNVKVSDSYIDKAGYYYGYDIAKDTKACPEGWRVATKDDFVSLKTYITQQGLDARSLSSKEGWYSGNKAGKQGTDDFGFCALPLGGLRTHCTSLGTEKIGYSSAVFWTSTQYTPSSGSTPPANLVVVEIYCNGSYNYNMYVQQSSSSYLDNIMYPIRCCRDKMPVDGN